MTTFETLMLMLTFGIFTVSLIALIIKIVSLIVKNNRPPDRKG